MNEDFRRQIVREFPELAAGYHMPIAAEVIAIPDSPKQGGVSDGYRPRFAVDVVLLNSNFEQTEIKFDHVPVSFLGGGNERGLFGLPPKGTLVEIAFLNGSPEHPFVRSVLGERQALPWNDATTMSWQQSESAKQSVDGSGNWSRETHGCIQDKSYKHSIDAKQKLENLGEEIKRVLQSSFEDVDGIKQIEAGAIHQLSMTVANILSLGSVNLVAGDHITRSASKNIVDKAGLDLIQEGTNINHTAQANLEVIGSKIHLGSDSENVLSLVSEFLQIMMESMTALSVLTVGCTAPGNPSLVPNNATNFIEAAESTAQLKLRLDAITK